MTYVKYVYIYKHTSDTTKKKLFILAVFCLRLRVNDADCGRTTAAGSAMVNPSSIAPLTHCACEGWDTLPLPFQKSLLARWLASSPNNRRRALWV